MSRIMRLMGDGRRRSALGAGLLLLCGVLALSACGGSSSASKPKLLPALQKAQTALKDATGTFTFASSSKTLTLSGSGSCQITAKPQRSLEVMKINGQSSTTIVDSLTTAYTQIPAQPGQTGTQWYKSSSLNDVVEDVSDVLDYASYTNTAQQADATVKGVALIHITGVEASGNTVDLYLTKDTYLPVSATIHHTDASAIDITVTFSKTNSGATIALPAAKDIIGA